MVSYKTLYEKQLEFVRKEWKSEYKCPLCNSVIMISISSVHCSNEVCTYEKSTDELFEQIATYKKYERVD